MKLNENTYRKRIYQDVYARHIYSVTLKAIINYEHVFLLLTAI